MTEEMIMDLAVLATAAVSSVACTVALKRPRIPKMYSSGLLLLAAAAVIDMLGIVFDVRNPLTVPYGCVMASACVLWTASVRADFGGSVNFGKTVLAAAVSFAVILAVGISVGVSDKPVDPTLGYALISFAAVVPAVFGLFSAVKGYRVCPDMFGKSNYSVVALCVSVPIACAAVQFAVSLPFVLLGLVSGMMVYFPLTQKDYGCRHPGESMISDRNFTQRYIHKAFEDCVTGKTDGLFIGFGDMDRFGTVKHEYGSDVTDGIIADIGNALSVLVTPEFFVGHNGGDEYLFLMKTNDAETAGKYVKQVYDAIAAYDATVPYTIHMSIGFVGYTDQKTVEDMIAAADENAVIVKEKYYADNGFERKK